MKPSIISLCPVCGSISYVKSYDLQDACDCDDCYLWAALILCGGVQ